MLKKITPGMTGLKAQQTSFDVASAASDLQSKRQRLVTAC
jgi:hypothetical protein